MTKISAEKRAEIVAAYLENDGATYKEIAKRFRINPNTISRIIRAELKAGNGIKPDRRKHIASGEVSYNELDQRHADVIAAKDPHPRTLNWMDHVKPLHQHKQELEQRVEHKQAELDAARQELRDFTATLRQLMGGDDV